MLLMKFPIISGCPKATVCRACKEGDGLVCSKKNVVYEAECRMCSQKISNITENVGNSDFKRNDMSEDPNCEAGSNVAILGEEDAIELSGCPIDQIGRGGNIKMCPSEHIDRGGNIKFQSSKDVSKQIYVGETSRVLRLRSEEHINKARRFERDSFIINHWFETHPDMDAPPEFNFKLLRCFKEAFGRQIFEAIMILDKGTLNSKLEYGINQICRLDNMETEWDTAEEQRRLWEERKEYNQKLKSFIVMKSSQNNKNDSLFCKDTTANNNLDACYRYNKLTTISRKRSLKSSGSKIEHKYTKFRKMDSSTPVHQNATRAQNDDPELESPILAIVPGGRFNEQANTMGEITFNDSTDGESYQDPIGGEESKKLKTNLSDELLSTRIGSVGNNNNSSREYAIGATNLQQAATFNGLLDETGAHVNNEEVSLEDRVVSGAPANDQMEGVDINTWNSESSFSNQESTNTEGGLSGILSSSNVPEGTIEAQEDILPVNEEAIDQDKSCPIDQIGRGGVLTLDNIDDASGASCPGDQIGRGGELNLSPKEGDREESRDVDNFSTPKRRLSPDELTPVGRAHKLTTNMESSPKLRSQHILHQPANTPTQHDGAPDLILGIGRLRLRPVAPNNVPVGALEEVNLEATERALGSDLNASQYQQPNVVERLIRVACRQRTLSVGRRGGRSVRGRSALRRNLGGRSISLGGQRCIDSIFSPETKGLTLDKNKKDENVSGN